jgi:hypothetical protein
MVGGTAWRLDIGKGSDALMKVTVTAECLLKQPRRFSIRGKSSGKLGRAAFPYCAPFSDGLYAALSRLYIHALSRCPNA